MDDDFFKKLDEALTNVGADKHFERRIGGRVVWLSPVPLKSQHKINELLSNQELGTNVFVEAKRMTLAYAIVGFDGFDLRKYRNDVPTFPMIDPREKKEVRVSLYKYLSHKMDEWGTEWVDSAFSVFADIMETVKKENLKEVTFDNARDKREELAELEEKVKELRSDLGMPPLVEFKVGEEPEEPAEPAVEPPTPEPPISFNPFQKVEPAPPPLPNPVPVVQPQARQPIAGRPVEAETSTPDRPYVARQNDDVIDRQSEAQAPSPIVIDPPQGNRNPRFQPPPGRYPGR